MKRLLLPLLLTASLACSTNQMTDHPTTPAPATPQSTTTPATTSDAGMLPVLPDTPRRLAQLPRTTVDYDRALLNENERQVVARLVEASQLIDELYWRQVAEENPAWRAQLEKQAPRSAVDRAGYEYFLANKGPWDRLDEDRPFVGTMKKPLGAAFYPTDMTKPEFEAYVAAHPAQKAELEGLFTVIRRDGVNLVAIPYSAYYADFLKPAAQKLREAAALTTDASLKRFLTTRADAFLDDNYRESDMAWMDLNGSIEVVIGPYEVYEDNLFNYKAAFESFVTVVDAPESAKLAAYAHALPDMEKNLPEPEQYRNPNRGGESPIKVVQEIYTAGDARRGVQTAAFNLPNDEFVREKKGSKKVLLKNVINAKYKQSGEPIAKRVLDPSQLGLLSFDAFFNQILFHELSHGLGPGFITQPDGSRVEVRIPLKNLYSTIEETKADVLGLWNIVYARNHGLLSAFDEKQLYATYTGLMFRSMRFGIGEAHGRGTAIQWNWIREQGGIMPSANGRYAVDFAKFADGVKSLSTELLTIEATGDFNRANALLEKYGRITPEIEGINKSLNDIPVDITPVYTGAGER
ncbi:MAG: Peptidase family [Acidobacteria bacterium]|nr:Peptidase family [Acidobacteriota bacterium]